MPVLGYDTWRNGVKGLKSFLASSILRYRPRMAPTNQWKEYATAAVVVGLVLAVSPFPVLAHGGALDALGCHHGLAV